MIEIIENEDLLGSKTSSAPKINKEELGKFLYSRMSTFTLEQLVGCITDEYREIIEYIDLCCGRKACKKTSLLFNPHRLSIKTKMSKMSIFEAIKQESFMQGVARSSLFQKGKVRELFYRSLEINVNHTQLVNEFPPHVARDIQKRHGLNPDSKVLDPCAGWGGRMLGTSVISNNYTAFEPSTKTYNGLLKLLTFIQGFRPDFNANMLCEPFEDSNLQSDFYDFAITSPPYYNSEEYSNEETNSLNRYKTFEEWVEGFYLPLIRKTMDALKAGSTFALNIGSRQYPLSDIMKEECSCKYNIIKDSSYFSGQGSGLGKSGEGETFYFIQKS